MTPDEQKGERVSWAIEQDWPIAAYLVCVSKLRKALALPTQP